MAKLKYQIKNAEYIFIKGVGSYSNKNLTNEIAEYLLSLGAAYQDIVVPLESETETKVKTKKGKKINVDKEQNSKTD